MHPDIILIQKNTNYWDVLFRQKVYFCNAKAKSVKIVITGMNNLSVLNSHTTSKFYLLIDGVVLKAIISIKKYPYWRLMSWTALNSTRITCYGKYYLYFLTRLLDFNKRFMESNCYKFNQQRIYKWIDRNIIQKSLDIAWKGFYLCGQLKNLV